MGAVLLAGLFIFWTTGIVVSTAAASAPQVFYTQKSAIIFQQYRDLNELALRLGATGAAGEPHLGVMSARIDGMLGEISEILQRQPLRPSRLQIYLLKDGFAVQQERARQKFARGGMASGRRALESFYDSRRRTIFLSLADARLGVLAHEMAHFMLCESFQVPPGEAYQEEVANYMERRFRAKPPNFSY
jgi:hypothetical protein